MSSESDEDLIDNFCVVTGATREQAERMLDVCNNNLTMAVNMYVDSSETIDSSSASSSSARLNPPGESSTGRINGSTDDIRAPIAPRQDILVPDVYVPTLRVKRTASSVFDGFRDFAAETRFQERLMGSASSTNPDNRYSDKQKTLEDLFRPPLDLLYKGSFNSARNACTARNKWLLVNVQNVQEFTCQMLNRDVWSNAAVRDLVSHNFILWQIYHDSAEGQRFMQFYKVHQWPHLAVIDPMTGENIVTWHQQDPLVICELLSAFVQEHPLPEHSLTNGVSVDDTAESPAKKLKTGSNSSSNGHSVSRSKGRSSSTATVTNKRDALEEMDDTMIDASEDAQMRAAIEASLREQTAVSSTSLTKTASSYRDGAGSDESDDNLETFDSDETSIDSAASSRKGRTNPVSVDGSSNSCSEEKVAAIESWRSSLGNDSASDDACCFFKLRLPSGTNDQVKFPIAAKLKVLIAYLEKQGYPQTEYDIVSTFPRLRLSDLDPNRTFKDVGFGKQETLFVQQI